MEMTEKNPQVGKRIRQLREIKGLSQSEIEKRTGIKREYLSKIENGDLDNPTLTTLKKLAQGLGVRIGKLFESDDSVKLKRAPIIKVISGNSQRGEQLEKQIKLNQYTCVPILDSAIIAKGSEYIDEEEIDDYALVSTSCLEATSDHNRYRCMWIKEGDESMHPIISPDSLVCIDSHQRNPHRLVGSIVSLRNDEGSCIVACLKIYKNNIVGIPENLNEYNPIVITITKKSPVLGKVVWYSTKLT